MKYRLLHTNQICRVHSIYKMSLCHIIKALKRGYNAIGECGDNCVEWKDRQEEKCKVFSPL